VTLAAANIHSANIHSANIPRSLACLRDESVQYREEMLRHLIRVERGILDMPDLATQPLGPLDLGANMRRNRSYVTRGGHGRFCKSESCTSSKYLQGYITGSTLSRAPGNDEAPPEGEAPKT
jgi:hypothetical protein